MNSKYQKGYTITELLFVIIWLSGIIGWVANLAQVVSYMLTLNSITAINGLAILKAIGIIIAPVGAVLGWCGMFL